MKVETTQSRSPQIRELLAELAEHQINYVLIGSVAAMAYGVEVSPGDQDVTPAMDQDNLTRLSAMLTEIEAKFAHPGIVGQWELQADGEQKWVHREATPAELRERLNWQPDPDDPDGFDSLFHTSLGNFDVVPSVVGTYEELLPGAAELELCGFRIKVQSVSGLLAMLTKPRREKDIARVRELRQIQRELGS